MGPRLCVAPWVRTVDAAGLLRQGGTGQPAVDAAAPATEGSRGDRLGAPPPPHPRCGRAPPAPASCPQSPPPSCPWRFTRLNTNHITCASYPSTLIVPAAATDEELLICAAFRSEQRLPVLTWGSAYSSASIWRASQPRVGVSGASCPEDEKILRLIGAGERGLLSSKQGNGGDGAPSSSSPSTSFPRPGQGTLRILDLRSKTAALANRATGHGYVLRALLPSLPPPLPAFFLLLLTFLPFAS
jgi:hypothetical protein